MIDKQTLREIPWVPPQIGHETSSIGTPFYPPCLAAKLGLLYYTYNIRIIYAIVKTFVSKIYNEMEGNLRLGELCFTFVARSSVVQRPPQIELAAEILKGRYESGSRLLEALRCASTGTIRLALPCPPGCP